MPEGYTHITTGEKALLKSGVFIYDRAAFCAGAQGPDPFFFYYIWKKNVFPRLYDLSSKMHNEKTGEFLTSLIKNSVTPVLKSYSLGFLTHYATDKNAHPYVNAITTHKNAPYNIPNGHGFYEIALDSELHLVEHGTRLVPVSRSTILPKREYLLEISRLLKIAIKEAYSNDISQADIYRSFCHMRLVRSLLRSRFGGMKKVYRFAEVNILKKDGYLLSHLTPADPIKQIPQEWQNDFTGQVISGGIELCLKTAIIEGSTFINFANDYWSKRITIDEFKSSIGSFSYETNLKV